MPFLPGTDVNQMGSGDRAAVAEEIQEILETTQD